MKKRDLIKKMRSEAANFVPDNKDQIMNKLSIEPSRQYKRKRFSFSYKFSLAFTIFVLSIIGLSLVLTRPVSASNSVITIEINPAFEIELDEFDNLIDIRGLNIDGTLVLETLPTIDWSTTTYLEAVNNLIEYTDRLGYLDADDSEVTINISAINNNQDKELEIADTFKYEIEKATETRNPNIIVRNNNDNQETKEKARNNNVSIGKMNLIERALQADENLSFNEAKEMTPKQLNEIINHYNKQKIEIFKNRYKHYNDLQDKAYEDLLEEFEDREKLSENLIKNIENLIDQNMNHTSIEVKINMLLLTYNINDYEFNPDNYDDKYDYYGEVIGDIKDYIDEYYEALLDYIEDLLDDNEEKYNELIKNSIKTNEYDFNFDYDFNFEIDTIINDFAKRRGNNSNGHNGR